MSKTFLSQEGTDNSYVTINALQLRTEEYSRIPVYRRVPVVIFSSYGYVMTLNLGA